MSRPRFQIRQVMIGIVWCALLAAGLRAPEEWRGLFIIVGVPATGSLIHQSIGGRGILGGAIGGGLLCSGFGIYAYFLSGPVTGDYIGPALAIPLLSLMGAAFGLVVGAVLWGLKIQVEDRDARYPWWSTPEPSKPKMPE